MCSAWPTRTTCIVSVWRAVCVDVCVTAQACAPHQPPPCRLSPPLPPNPLTSPGLATNAYFDDPAFLAYLAHLAYWRRPEYARHLTHPHALFALDLLSSPALRRALARPTVADAIHGQQLWFWQGWRAARAAEKAAEEENEGE